LSSSFIITACPNARTSRCYTTGIENLCSVEKVFALQVFTGFMCFRRFMFQCKTWHELYDLGWTLVCSQW